MTAPWKLMRRPGVVRPNWSIRSTDTPDGQRRAAVYGDASCSPEAHARRRWIVGGCAGACPRSPVPSSREIVANYLGSGRTSVLRLGRRDAQTPIDSGFLDGAIRSDTPRFRFMPLGPERDVWVRSPPRAPIPRDLLGSRPRRASRRQPNRSAPLVIDARARCGSASEGRVRSVGPRDHRCRHRHLQPRSSQPRRSHRRHRRGKHLRDVT